MKRILWLTAALCLTASSAFAYDTPGAGNPIIPGYFADPTVKKFGDTYYIYATTDGNGGGFGPSQVWVSKDFVNWTIMPMNWPTTHYIWAPDVMHHSDGKYYMYYCVPCMVFCGVGETPRGPWRNLLGEGRELIPDRFVKNAITLDGQSFTDDDGRVYLYWGTWGIYKGFGCGTGRLAPDMMSFDTTRLIVNTEAEEFFEAPFVIKKDGVYYFTYSSGSCHTETYRVQYATSTTGPMGPYRTAPGNPILATNADSTIHGPGHHSILKEGDSYYIVYHRHDIPQSTRGMHRQIAADRLEFGPGNTIRPIEAGHQGIGFLQPSTNPFENLAFGKEVRASSWYNESFRPEYAVDDNNATLWRPKTSGLEWLEIDLGKVCPVERIWIQFEYATSYYQYITETSIDGKEWHSFADKSDNRQSGSPMVDYGHAEARYVRIFICGNEKNGLSGAIWNLKVFGGYQTDPPQRLAVLSSADLAQDNGFISNRHGMLAGQWETTGGPLCISETDGRKALQLEPKSTLSLAASAFANPQEYTLSYKIFSTRAETLRRIVFWGQRQTLAKSLPTGKDSPAWHDVAYVSDGKTVKLYLDGTLNASFREKPSAAGPRLELRSGQKRLTLTDLRLYNWCLEPAELQYDSQQSVSAPEPESALPHQGLLFDLCADNYRLNSQPDTLDTFLSEGNPVNVELRQGRKAFCFDGRQRYVRHIPLPKTLVGSPAYSIEAWVLNPSQAPEECILDLVNNFEELGRIGFGNGFHPESGTVNHNGSFENIGLPGYPADGSWQHWAVSYDGYKEKVFLNGELVFSKDIVLILPPAQESLLGMAASGESPFSGYLHRICAYDRALSEDEVYYHSLDKGESDILWLLDASQFGSDWTDEGRWGGKAAVTEDHQGLVCSHLGRQALCRSVEVQDVHPKDLPGCLVLDFALAKKNRKARQLLAAEGMNLSVSSDGIQLNGIKLPSTALIPGQWHEIVVVPEDIWKVYLDAELIASLELPSPAFGNCLILGDQDLFLTRMEFNAHCPAAGQLKENLRNLRCNALSARHFSLQGTALSPSLVRLEVLEDGHSLTDGSLLFRYGPGAWTNQPETNLSLKENGQEFKVEIIDRQGNLRDDIPPVKISVQPESFVHYGPSLQSSDWDGMLCGEKARPYVEIVSDSNGFSLGSANGDFVQEPEANGPLLYREVCGDFLMNVHIADLTGREHFSTPGYNEGGLMVLCSEEDGSQTLLQLGAFPLFNCGNMFTCVTADGRFQYNNSLGWQFNPYLQIQRHGDCFHFRTSPDGKTWEEMPNSPVLRPEWRGKALKAGVYQVTYTDSRASFRFDGFDLWVPKQ